MKERILILRNNATHVEKMYFNPRTQEIEVFEMDEDIETNGKYDYIKGFRFLFFPKKDRMMLYARGEHLYVHVNNQELCLNDDLLLSYKRRCMMITFSIYHKQKKVYSITYRSFRYDFLNMIDPDFTDDREEDQDICLFIYNMFKDPEWMRRFLINNIDNYKESRRDFSK
ncbi:hypothetical protein IC620_15150 [Hazenella sp. IB182357]|uniref:Uncharacterized protein n=1 Tax=Polycladospora coralii TaxID=2771432 RepID=A0A926RVD0_9BACL|nr:hypothetical protein [Polycladospora coralii]MBD1373682.1 hypothetical protein [Polycladospora coralii]